jgi:hypothetical protein
VRTNGIVDVLAGVEGIILLIDPTKMMAEAAPPPNGTDNPPTYKYLNKLFRALDSRLLRTTGSGDGWLPHRISVCVSKFDHPAVYQRAKQLGLVERNGGQPVVPTGEAARLLFESICRSSISTNDADIPDMIKKYFQRGRVSYHVVSAIGFYTDPLDGFREDDSGNVIVRGGQPHIRRLQPSGVWESLVDLFEAIRKGRTA